MFNFHWQNFFCEFVGNNAKVNGICSKIVVIKKKRAKNQRKEYLIRKIYSERLQKGDLLVRDLRLNDQE